MSEKRKYRQFTPEQKTEIVLAGLRGDRSVRDVCGEHEIAETLYYQWRDKLLEGGKQALAAPRDKAPERAEINQLKKKVGQLERALGRKTYELEIAGEALRGSPRATSPRPSRASCRSPARPSTDRSADALWPLVRDEDGRVTTPSSRSPRPTRSTAPGWSPLSPAGSSASR